MLELLSPAGSPEAVIAAVQSGADAIYMGFGGFNARRGAKNFTDEEFEAALRYCRVRGCKVYVTLNTLVSDRELPQALELAHRADELGASAILVQDLGLLRALHRALPDMPLHASTQMSVHNLAGVEAAAEMGARRVVLARELSLDQIRLVARHSPIETEVFAHGALCFCHSGQCYMSALIGRRSGNRGMCAQPCRLQYSMGRRMDDYPLSLKDNCLVSHLAELEDAGVTCVKIEGRMKRPEYTAIATGVYARAIRDKKPPTPEEMEQLELAFSRQGFTDGYFTHKLDTDMFGVRQEADRETNRLFSDTRKAYSGTELRRVPVRFYAVVKKGEPSRIAVEDGEGHRVSLRGPVPERAERAALTAGGLSDQLYKTGGTPYACAHVDATVDDGLFLPAAAINELRRRLLADLSEQRKLPEAHRFLPLPPAPRDCGVRTPPVLNFQVMTAEQMTEELAVLRPHCLYVPLELLAEAYERALPFAEQGARVVAVLPRVITDSEMTQAAELLKKLRDLGIHEALVGNMGHIQLAALGGFQLRGDFGLNLFNARSLQVMADAGFLSATASFELRLGQVRDMAKPLDTELIVYGRLPAMVTEQCIIKNSAGKCACAGVNNLADRRGAVFPVVREFGCRNVILNTHKLFLADKRTDYEQLGLWAVRLLFTTESPRECVEVARSYLGQSDYRPNGLTRGLYYRGVE
jgi:putative protease